MHEYDAPNPERPRGPPPQYTLRQLFLLTTLVAIACSLSSWLGSTNVLLVVAAAAGAFLGAFACPWVGLDYVLDNIQADVFRCLGVGFYIMGTSRGVAWATSRLLLPGPEFLLLLPMIGEANWLGVLLVITSGILAFIGLFFLVRWFWPLTDKAEMVVVAGSAIMGAIVAAVWLPHLVR